MIFRVVLIVVGQQQKKKYAYYSPMQDPFLMAESKSFQSHLKEGLNISRRKDNISITDDCL